MITKIVSYGLLAAGFALALSPDLLAGAIGWEQFADDASQSAMGMAHGAIPLVVSAGVVSALWSFAGTTNALIATGGGAVVASNGDVVQGMVGGGGGGGQITDLVFAAAHAVQSLPVMLS